MKIEDAKNEGFENSGNSDDTGNVDNSDKQAENSVEVGDIITGEVVRIMPFGAFVRLPNGKDGLVHISEISRDYVTNIGDFLKEGQVVTAKVLAMNTGKVALSIRKADSENSPVGGLSEGNGYKSDDDFGRVSGGASLRPNLEKQLKMCLESGNNKVASIQEKREGGRKR
ncbi:MAG: S1 RNA-binding domain-containing protein [Oscillospiraceae bacterium]|jgi:predicted RNA-binding protein with RPS1 domain|nr:S1 RNA-binding domain-containing protein [Oscillospiraceae bacterium]